MNGTKALLAAFAVGGVLAAQPALAIIDWNTDGATIFEDQDLDFYVQDVNGDGILDPGDVLLAVLEVEEAGGTDIGPAEELTGVAVIEVVAIMDVDGNGVDDIIFGPASAGLNFWAGTSVTGGGAGGSATIAWYLDDSPDLDVSASSIPNLSCATLAECLAQATDGDLWQVEAFNDPDDFWVALNAERDTSIVLAGNPVNEFGAFNIGQSILFNGTGQVLEPNSLSCAPFCGAGGDGFVDFLAGGSVKGGAGLVQTLYDDGAFATSDFDFTKVAGVPEPATVGLLAAGLLGLGAMQRRRRTKA